MLEHPGEEEQLARLVDLWRNMTTRERGDLRVSYPTIADTLAWLDVRARVRIDLD